MAILDFTKLPAEKHVGVFIGPSGGTTLGITEIHEPLTAEINNTGGLSGMVLASHTIDWNDLDFGTQASETTNQPSLADSASYETFGASNYGGNISFFLPAEYDDDSNLHSLIYDLTDTPLDVNDLVMRIDGDIDATAPAADGQFVHAYRAQIGSEENPFTPGESKRRTVGYLSRGDFAHYTVVGDHAITAIPPASFAAGSKGRIRASQQSRDTTNSLRFTSSDTSVIEIAAGGFYEVVGDAADTATITIRDPYTNDIATVPVTVGTP